MMLLVHSPLLGPSTWDELLPLLDSAGWSVAVPDLRPLVETSPFHPAVCESAAAAAASSARVVVVGHSRAGPYLPGIAAALGSAVSEVVFLDARLPYPGRSWLSSLTADQAGTLRELTHEDRLATWDRWFSPDALEGLLPDPQQRERIRQELAELPWSLVTEELPAVAGAWNSARHIYVRLSAAYETVAAQAEDEGYAVLRHQADHLAMLTNPSTVANLVLSALA